MFDMFSNKEEQTPEPPMPEVTDNTPVMTESTPVGGGAETPQETPNEMSQAPDMNQTPDMPSVPATPDMSPVSSMDTSVSEPVTEPVENVGTDAVSTPAQEQTAPSIGEMPVDTVAAEITASTETDGSLEKAKRLVSEAIESKQKELQGLDDEEQRIRDEKNRANSEMGVLKKLQNGLESNDPEVISMAKFLIKLNPEENNGTNVSEPQTSDTQAA